MLKVKEEQITFKRAYRSAKYIAAVAINVTDS